MKLCIFKNGINLTDPTVCIHNSLCGNMSRNFNNGSILEPVMCSFLCLVRYIPSYINNLCRYAHLDHFIILLKVLNQFCLNFPCDHRQYWPKHDFGW